MDKDEGVWHLRNFAEKITSYGFTTNHPRNPESNPALREFANIINNPSPVDVTPTRMLRVKSVNEWNDEAANRPDPNPLWLSLWFEQEVCCLFSDSNLGKSIYAVQIASKIAANRRVIYFDFELTDKSFQLRYTNDKGILHPFPENFLRAEIDPNNIVDGDFESAVIDEIEQAVIDYQASVIIIDNLTWLCMASEKGDAASRLMMRLRQLRDRHNLSILIVAHTPKRSLTSPITQNDLAGSKKLFNFFSSVFAIGKSAKDPNLRYVKQIKTRAGAFEYGGDNVIVCEITKEDTFLNFSTLGYASEKEHLQEVTDTDRNQMEENVRNLRLEGNSVRKIAELLGLSKSSVSRTCQRLGI